MPERGDCEAPQAPWQPPARLRPRCLCGQGAQEIRTFAGNTAIERMRTGAVIPAKAAGAAASRDPLCAAAFLLPRRGRRSGLSPRRQGIRGLRARVAAFRRKRLHSCNSGIEQRNPAFAMTFPCVATSLHPGASGCLTSFAGPGHPRLCRPIFFIKTRPVNKVW
jgi:hypothetical protein